MQQYYFEKEKFQKIHLKFVFYRQGNVSFTSQELRAHKRQTIAPRVSSATYPYWLPNFPHMAWVDPCNMVFRHFPKGAARWFWTTDYNYNLLSLKIRIYKYLKWRKMFKFCKKAFGSLYTKGRNFRRRIFREFPIYFTIHTLTFLVVKWLKLEIEKSSSPFATHPPKYVCD